MMIPAETMAMVDQEHADRLAEKNKRIEELETALRDIADGYLDQGGCRRVRSDSILIARGALGLQ